MNELKIIITAANSAAKKAVKEVKNKAVTTAKNKKGGAKK